MTALAAPAAAPPSTLEMTREQWLAERRKGIGGSDAAAACGLDPFKTRLRLYLEKRGEVAEEDISQKMSVRFGNRLEQAVADEYEQQTGQKVARVNRILQSKTHPFMLANLDRRIIGSRRILEIKTTGYWAAKSDEDWGPAGTDLVPIRYMMQVQHYMHVAEASGADLAVLIGGQEFRCYTIQRDKALIDLLIEHETDFWRRVQQGDPPPAVSLDDSLSRFPVAQDRVVYATDEIAEMVGVLSDHKRYEKERKAEIEAIKARVTEFMGDGNVLMLGQTPIATWKNRAKTSLDTDRLKKERPEVYEEFARRGSARAFLLAGEK